MPKKVPTIQPIKEKRTFKTPEEFTEFYNAHEDFFEKTTTCKLNKMYEVPGFKITKLQGVVSLKNIPESRVTANDKIEKLSNRVLTLEEMMNKCIKTVNETVTKTNAALEELHRIKDSLTRVPPPVTHHREPEPMPERTPSPPEEKPEPSNPPRRVPGKMNPIAAQWAGLIDVED